MVNVSAKPVGPGWECTVEVEEGTTRSRHTVRVDPVDLRRWGRPGETAEQLVERAFEFLLAREPASQILRRFAVADIERYFPEFDEEIRRL
jgi:hypothetical protein